MTRTPPERLDREERARGLAALVDYCVLTQPQAIRDRRLGLSCDPAGRGTVVWDAMVACTVLQVDAQGGVQCYRPGSWEEALLRLVRQGLPRGTGDTLQLTLDLTAIGLLTEAIQADEEKRRERRLYNPLERLGAACLRAIYPR